MSKIHQKKKLKIDLGCGKKPRPGFIGVDKSAKINPDIICDVERDPLPLDDNSVSWVWMSDFIEHIEDIFKLFREIYRVCENGARVDVISPYYTSIRATMDPTHKHFISERTFEYLNESFYVTADYNIDFKFTIEKIYFSYTNKIFSILNRFKKIAQKYIPNSIESIHVILKVHK
ncbi:MAG: class I SAM-dependent methyltransferase [Candidatus Helarchaeota archaeon]